jgi:hypothetical protein
MISLLAHIVEVHIKFDSVLLIYLVYVIYKSIHNELQQWYVL